MREHKVRSWTGFIRLIDEIRREYALHQVSLGNGQSFKREVRLLFRGQADVRWPLATTLERKTSKQFDVLTYLDYATRGVSEIESFTGTRWKIPEWPDLEAKVIQEQENYRIALPSYDFLVYLRHNGFPSPLLDWTESPFIAAYFAYISAIKNPAIYCYIERPGLGKGGMVGQPMITVQGPHVTTHKRHFAQKAWYTVSTCWSTSENRHIFCPHDLVFRRETPSQDILIKISLPFSERQHALRQLNDYNINHFTLFQSEDSLIKAIETKIFDIPLQF